MDKMPVPESIPYLTDTDLQRTLTVGEAVELAEKGIRADAAGQVANHRMRLSPMSLWAFGESTRPFCRRSTGRRSCSAWAAATEEVELVWSDTAAFFGGELVRALAVGNAAAVCDVSNTLPPVEVYDTRR
jgi:hypothetical protein